MSKCTVFLLIRVDSCACNGRSLCCPVSCSLSLEAVVDDVISRLCLHSPSPVLPRATGLTQIWPPHTHTHTHTHTQTHTLNTAPTPTPFSFFNSQAYSFAHTRHIPAPAVSLCTFSILFKLWFVVQLDVCITWYLHVGVCACVRVCVGVYVCV